MKKTNPKLFLVTLIVILIGAALAWAGSQNSVQFAGLPLFALAVAFIFIIQWLAFIPAYLLQTEKFFDITGSLTYITVTILAVVLSQNTDARSLLLLGLVTIWAVRLGSFLFQRIHHAGKDDRFDEIKPDFFRFLNTWTLQGLWVSFTLSAALAVITSAEPVNLDLFAVVGAMIWLFGLSFEATADSQKSRFREDPANKGNFIRSGLWARSRHPNYFGEIVLWVGVMVIALPVLQGWQWVTLISPIFVTLLLTKVSGIPMLEKKADQKWGGQPEYEEYKKTTPVLIPKL